MSNLSEPPPEAGERGRRSPQRHRLEDPTSAFAYFVIQNRLAGVSGGGRRGLLFIILFLLVYVLVIPVSVIRLSVLRRALQARRRRRRRPWAGRSVFPDTTIQHVILTIASEKVETMCRMKLGHSIFAVALCPVS